MSAKSTGSNERMVTLDVCLLGRDYKVACKPDEQAELKDAVAFLERRMQEVRETSKTSSVERVAVMAALNLAHDFQRDGRATSKRAPAAPTSPDSPLDTAPLDTAEIAALRRRIAAMQSAIDQILPAKEKLF